MRTSRAAAAMQRGDAEDLFNRFTRATSVDDLPPPPPLLLLVLLLFSTIVATSTEPPSTAACKMVSPSYSKYHERVTCDV